MKVCVTLAELAPGQFCVIKDPDTDIMAHKRLVSDLARKFGRGSKQVMVLTSDGPDRRARLALPDSLNTDTAQDVNPEAPQGNPAPVKPAKQPRAYKSRGRPK